MAVQLMTPRGAPLSQASVRAHNLALLLGHIASSPTPISRAKLATATGLARATVSALVDDLIAGNLITEHDPAPRTGAGRPAIGLALSPDGPAGLGLEINVDYLAACVVDLTGAVRHRIVEHVDQRPVEARTALTTLADLAGRARALAETDGLTLAGAAVAVPGLVGADGIVHRAPNLGWHGVAVAATLRDTPALRDLPVIVDNEANFAAVGALRADPDIPASFLYVSGEIGIGAGIVLDGSLYRGVRGWSGEIGHIPVRPDGPSCRCGARGCLERYAGQEAILRAAHLPDDGVPGKARTLLAERARAGEPDATAALADAATALGTVVASVINMLDIDTIVLGGSYAPLLPWLQDGVQREITQRVLTAGLAPITVRAAKLGADAAMVGAGGSVVCAVRDDPAHWLTSRQT